MDFFFNITSDVLSYAYQLLFYITLPCKHSSILPVLLSLDTVPFSSIQHREADDRQVEVSRSVQPALCGKIPGLYVAVEILSPRLW